MSAAPELFILDRIPTPIGPLLIGFDAEARLRILDEARYFTGR